MPAPDAQRGRLLASSTTPSRPERRGHPSARPLPSPRGTSNRRSVHPRRRARRRGLVLVGLVLALAAAALVVAGHEGSSVSPLRARIVSIAQGQVGYTTNPTDSYCNKFSAYWQSGDPTARRATRASNGAPTSPPGSGRRRAPWSPTSSSTAISTHRRPVSTSGGCPTAPGTRWVQHYQPQPGDVAVYGLNAGALAATHVAVVTGYSAGNQGPDVVNGDGDRTGFSVVETGTDQYRADTKGSQGALSGYVSPSAPIAPSATNG